MCPLAGEQVGGTVEGVGGPHTPSSQKNSCSQGKQAAEPTRREHNGPALDPQPSWSWSWGPLLLE